MAHALRLAARGNGTTWPNPSVGCILVHGSRIVGRGTTAPGGRPHAEAAALAQAGALAQGATAYVTLEPCAHQGRAGPCSDALVAAGVARVVTALTDPDPRTAGQGHARLRAAGIAVTTGVLAAPAARITAGFLKRVTSGLPMVTLKLATSLDARIATATGESRWITGPLARRHVHALRLCHDAVLIGAGTALADDPDLTVRDLGARHQPVRVVLDTDLRHRPESRLGQSARQAPVWLLHGSAAPDAARQAWQAVGARLIETPARDATAALRTLAAQGLTRILCEGGSTLAAALLQARLVDDLALYTAGLALGADALPALAPLPLTALADVPRLTLQESATLGPDHFTLWSL